MDFLMLGQDKEASRKALLVAFSPQGRHTVCERVPILSDQQKRNVKTGWLIETSSLINP